VLVPGPGGWQELYECECDRSERAAARAEAVAEREALAMKMTPQQSASAQDQLRTENCFPGLLEPHLERCPSRQPESPCRGFRILRSTPGCLAT